MVDGKTYVPERSKHKHQVSTYLDDYELSFLNRKMKELGQSRSNTLRYFVRAQMASERTKA